MGTPLAELLLSESVIPPAAATEHAIHADISRGRGDLVGGEVAPFLWTVDLYPILAILLHIRIDPVWYGSEQRCQTVRLPEPGQYRMQTYAVFGSNFGANEHSMVQIARAIEKPPATVFSYLRYHGGIAPRVNGVGSNF